MRKSWIQIIMLFVILALVSCKDNTTATRELPDIKMPDNNLSFKMIQGYENYKLIATHFRTDKDELRYIMANDIAYNALTHDSNYPDGSIIVKIGWTTLLNEKFPVSKEANKIQRIEFMYKDSVQFSKNPGNWGYARFIKDENSYKPWVGGTNSCIECHNIAKESDFVFTKYQTIF